MKIGLERKDVRMENKSYKRVDVRAKVTGCAKYTDDLPIGDVLTLKVLRSPHAHARIRSIDIKKALEVPGVVDAYTAADLPSQGDETNRPTLVRDTVRYIGDGVAVVVAESEQAAEEGVRSIAVDYEVMHGIFTLEEALQDNANPIHGKSNVASHWYLDRGDVAQGFIDADVVFERDYSTHAVYHGHMETEVAMAEPSDDGITVYCPSKLPTIARNAVAGILGLRQNQVRMIQPAIGGSFGAKGPDAIILSARVGLAALRTGRPVKAVYTREESIVEGTKRHPFKMHYKVGASKNGKLTAMDITLLADAGAYCNETPRVTARAVVEATGPYVVPNVKVEVKGVYTNQVNSDAVRGFGSPQVDYASEQMMDELANLLGIDALELRRINGFKDGSISATGQEMTAVGLDDCLDALDETLEWKKRKKEIVREASSGKSRGVGIACMFRGESKGAAAVDTAGVNIQTQPDGSIIVYSGIAEVGQGGYTMILSVISQVLGVNPERIHISSYDSNYSPDGGPTVASRGTVASGNAAKLAADQIKEKLARVASDKLGVGVDGLVFADDKITDIKDDSRSITFNDAVKGVYAGGDNAYGYGWWSAPETTWNYETGDVSDCKPYFSYVYGANGAEVEVDLTTGKVEVLKFVGVHDVGYALNPEEVKNQIAGGVSMGIGYALTEDLNMKDGKIQNDNYCNYLMPTSLDIKEVIPVIVEHAGPDGPLGAKGLGEPATSIVAPAILNAIADAIGCRVYDLPASLERVQNAIAEEKVSQLIELPEEKEKVLVKSSVGQNHHERAGGESW